MQYTVDAIAQFKPVSLQLEAADTADATRQAQARGWSVVQVRPTRTGLWRRSSGAGVFPLVQFNQSLLLLLQAGLSIVEAIETLADRESRPDTKQVLAQVREQLNTGVPLSVALERQPKIFPPLFVASVRANERTGALQEAIERFNLYQARAEQMRRRIVGASIYPAMILGVGGLVIAFLLFYVVPRFSVVFMDLGERIPLMSRLLLQWGQFVQAHGPGLAAGVLATLVLITRLLATPAVRGRIGRLLLKVPRVGEAVKTYQLSRFYRALGMLLQAGIPVVTALEMAQGLLPASLRPALAAARGQVGEGMALSAAFDAQGLTTVVSRRLLRVAERTGAMGEMLERTAAFHDEDIAQAIDWFVRLFEPVLMIVIGMIIGLVVLLMYAPIFELAGSLQ